MIWALIPLLLITEKAHAGCHQLFPSPHLQAGSAFQRNPTVPPSPTSPYAARTHAILVMGGDLTDADHNYRGFWNNLSFAYLTLLQRGVPRSQIQVLLGDGPQGRPMLTWNRSATPRVTAPYPLDLNCDDQPDIDGAANAEGIRQALDRLRPGMRTGDQLIVTLNGHGYYPMPLEEHSVRVTEESLTTSDLANVLSQVPTGVTTGVYIQSCYSGGFLHLANADRCIVTSASSERRSQTDTYSFGFEGLWSAWLGARARPGEPSLPNPDLNADSAISMDEAYRAAFAAVAAVTDRSLARPRSSEPELWLADSAAGRESLNRLANSLATSIARDTEESSDSVRFPRGGHLVESAVRHAASSTRGACRRIRL